MSDAKKYWVHPWESDAPEQIWIWGWQVDSSWQSQTWQHEDEPISTMKYIRADRIEELEAKLAKAVEALTPSGETKAAYIAEVETDCPSGRAHTVSWTATKDIMKMIRHRAELTGGKDE